MINEIYSSTEMIAVIELYEELQDELIRLVCSSIARRGYVSDTAAWQLEVLRDSGVVYKDAVAIIAKRTGRSEKLLKTLFQKAGITTTEFDNGIYKLAGLAPTPIQLSPDLTQILEAGMMKTNASLANLTGTTAISAQQAYINACNAAYMQVQSGGVDYAQAISHEIRRAAQAGVTVLYPSGHKDQLDVAVRRATLTGVTQTCGKVSMRNAELMGCDLMEITAHAGARPSHAKWQGKIVSLSGRKGYLSLDDIGYGTGDGFQGWNCRHNWFPFFEGIDTRAYTAAYLEKLQKDGLYELQEKQREYERRIRATKRELAGLDAAAKANPELAEQLQEQFTQKSVLLKKREAALEEFTKTHNLQRDKSREQAYYGKDTTQGFGRSTAQKAVWANRKAGLKTDSNDGIIKMNRRASNLGSFSTLPERMSKKHIREIADKYGIEIKGLTLTIDTNIELLKIPITGEADSEHIGRIIFLPNAFRNEEELLRTLYHERIHVFQFRKYGADFVQNNRERFEREAESLEEEFIYNLKKEGLL